ncbi:MAG TPA: hypothetical protein VN820_04530, partial [Acidimicrobiales bacterium]|nr:hypothetical protein [Acidimicrobiales bacterium]
MPLLMLGAPGRELAGADLGDDATDKVGPQGSSGQGVHELAERPRRTHDGPPDEQRFGNARWRHHDGGRGQRVRERKRSRHRTDRAVETELADEGITGDFRRLELAGGDEQADGDRKVEAPAPVLRTPDDARLTVTLRSGH